MKMLMKKSHFKSMHYCYLTTKKKYLTEKNTQKNGL